MISGYNPLYSLVENTTVILGVIYLPLKISILLNYVNFLRVVLRVHNF